MKFIIKDKDMNFINKDTDKEIQKLNDKIDEENKKLSKEEKKHKIEKTPYEKNEKITNYVIFIHYSGPGAMVDGDTHIGTEWFNINRYIREIS